MLGYRPNAAPLKPHYSAVLSAAAAKISAFTSMKTTSSVLSVSPSAWASWSFVNTGGGKWSRCPSKLKLQTYTTILFTWSAKTELPCDGIVIHFPNCQHSSIKWLPAGCKSVIEWIIEVCGGEQQANCNFRQEVAHIMHSSVNWTTILLGTPVT